MEKQIEINYDGECAFCNYSISWLRRHDCQNRFSYKTLPPGASRVILHDGEGTWKASTAALRTLVHLGGVWGVIARVLIVIPRPIRDTIYRLIARHRHRLVTGPEAAQSNAE